jgi:hypothetical protein
MRLVCPPYDLFDADPGKRLSNGRTSSIRPSSVLCESERRFIRIAEKLTAHACCAKKSSALQWLAQSNYRLNRDLNREDPRATSRGFLCWQE